MNIDVNIERLILDGVPLPPGQQPQVRAAVEAELARLLAEGGLYPELAAGGAVPSLPAGNVEMTGDGNPAQLGTQIARAVYGGIGR
jgi:hypothetical protein